MWVKAYINEEHVNYTNMDSAAWFALEFAWTPAKFHKAEICLSLGGDERHERSSVLWKDNITADCLEMFEAIISRVDEALSRKKPFIDFSKIVEHIKSAKIEGVTQ